MDFFLVAFVAVFVSALTLYSGFGLGTILMPVFALFFPVQVAVAATAVVHGANNVFKIAVVGKHAERDLVIRFGVPAIAGALAGATALGYVSHLGEITRYPLGPHTAVVTPIKIVMGILMFLFALLEILPGLRDIGFRRNHLFMGGILSGFFGGFSGHQGALRSAFLARVESSTESFVGTNAVIGFIVDMARILTYGATFLLAGSSSPIAGEQWPLVITGILAAFAGVMIGKRFLRKITMKTVRKMTGLMLLAIAIALGAGII